MSFPWKFFPEFRQRLKSRKRFYSITLETPMEDGMIQACEEARKLSGHPNKLPFVGVVCIIDQPSDKAPSGARGHRVILTQKAAEAALDSLVGMAIGFKDEWDGHDPRQKCGVIMSAAIVGDELQVRGHVYSHHFPEIVEKMRGDKPLGMSYELDTCTIEDMRKDIWCITSCTFVGAAVLYATKAAYWSTSFRLEE